MENYYKEFVEEKYAEEFATWAKEKGYEIEEAVAEEEAPMENVAEGEVSPEDMKSAMMK